MTLVVPSLPSSSVPPVQPLEPLEEYCAYSVTPAVELSRVVTLVPPLRWVNQPAKP